MTQECEERIIRELSEFKTLLIEHKKQHDDKSQSLPVWLGIFFSTAIGVFSLFNVGGKP